MKQDQPEITYINLLRGFYSLGFQHDLTPQGIAVFHAILYRSNELRFPSRIRISNTEICGNAGELKRNSLLSVREKLCAFEYNGHKLIEYEPEGNQRAGWYRVNYKLLMSNIITEQSQYSHSLVTVQSQPDHTSIIGNSQNSDQSMTEVGVEYDDSVIEKPDFGDDPRLEETREEKTEETRQGVPTTKKVTHDSDETKEPPPPVILDSDREAFQKARKAIEFNFDVNYFTSRKGLMPAKRQMMVEIGKYPDNLIKSAIEKKGNGLRNPEYLISNVLEELKGNNNGHKPENIKLLSDGVSREFVEEQNTRNKAGHSRDTKDVLKAMQTLCNVYGDKPDDTWKAYESRLKEEYTYEQFIEGVKG